MAKRGSIEGEIYIGGNMIGIGVIGYGYWGPNLVRNFVETASARVETVSDLRDDRLISVKTRYPSIRTTTNYQELLCDPKIDAIVIATPVSSHYELAKQGKEAGKHVWVEKPLAATVDEGLRLLEIADKTGLTLLVDHTFLYTGAVKKIKEILNEGLLGPVFYYDAVRVNLGLIQHDVNVLWDLAVHDLSIMDYVLEKRPEIVSAVGSPHIGNKEDVAYLTCIYPDGLIGHVHANWLAPVKVRRTLIGGANQMIVYDDLEPSEKVKLYDKGITINSINNGHGQLDRKVQLMVGYRTGDMWSPKLITTEALFLEANHFIECIEKNEVPLTNGEMGLRLVHTLEVATRSMELGGKPLELRWERLAV